MSTKQKNLLSDKKLLELKVDDSLTNLEEYARMMTDDIDFDSFDVLSITRLDADKPYTRKFTHPRIESQAHRIASDEGDTLPTGVKKSRLN